MDVVARINRADEKNLYKLLDTQENIITHITKDEFEIFIEKTKRQERQEDRIYDTIKEVKNILDRIISMLDRIRGIIK